MLPHSMSPDNGRVYPLQQGIFQPRRFAGKPDQNGDPIHNRFNDDELRMLGPILKSEFQNAEPTSDILENLPYKRYERSRILRTVAEYCMYKGWLNLGMEASKRAGSTTALQLWEGYLLEDGKTEQAAEIGRRLREMSIEEICDTTVVDLKNTI